MCGKLNTTSYCWAVLLAVLLSSGVAAALQWDNSVDMDEEFRLLWNIKGSEVTFEVQVATLGYVGIGFSANGAMDNADMAIGWVDQGQAYFQVGAEGEEELIYLTSSFYGNEGAKEIIRLQWWQLARQLVVPLRVNLWAQSQSLSVCRLSIKMQQETKRVVTDWSGFSSRGVASIGGKYLDYKFEWIVSNFFTLNINSLFTIPVYWPLTMGGGRPVVQLPSSSWWEVKRNRINNDIVKHKLFIGRRKKFLNYHKEPILIHHSIWRIWWRTGLFFAHSSLLN